MEWLGIRLALVVGVILLVLVGGLAVFFIWSTPGDREESGEPDYGDDFVSITAGPTHACGLRRDGSIFCWGANTFGQAISQSGAFTSVSTGTIHTCGLRRDGGVVCWGNDGSGRATPPGGSFRSVSAGGAHTCGVRSDRSLACWGDNAFGQVAPPEGSFTSVSAGGLHACAVRSNGSVTCWGADDSGQADPPGGTFTRCQCRVETHLRDTDRRLHRLLGRRRPRSGVRLLSGNVLVGERRGDAHLRDFDRSIHCLLGRWRPGRAGGAAWKVHRGWRCW